VSQLVDQEMSNSPTKETTGAWVIHHGRKLALDTNGSADFPAIDQAAKAATLLTRLGETNETNLTQHEAQAVARAAGLNPHYELNGLLQTLERKRLVDLSTGEIAILGVTTRASLTHAADIYRDAKPTAHEDASLSLAERTSQSPVRRSEIAEAIGDEHQLATGEVREFLNRAQEIGFVDSEGEGADSLLFNGNLFRRGSALKTERVLASLSSVEQQLVQQVAEDLAVSGCLPVSYVEKIITKPMFEKLVAAGVYDINEVSNEHGSHVYITLPSAFHKFVDPMVDDCFDMAKLLVSALTYGMNYRRPSAGKISMLSALLNKLVSGREIGPATAIGQDYRALEVHRVVKLRQDNSISGRFYMRLLKTEVGLLAQNVLTQGNADAQTLNNLPSAPMNGYLGPEVKRTSVRKNQTTPSKRTTYDILEAVRGGRSI